MLGSKLFAVLTIHFTWPSCLVANYRQLAANGSASNDTVTPYIRQLTSALNAAVSSLSIIDSSLLSGVNDDDKTFNLASVIFNDLDNTFRDLTSAGIIRTVSSWLPAAGALLPTGREGSLRGLLQYILEYLGNSIEFLFHVFGEDQFLPLDVLT
ncbi:hypothetical protein L218DRAFT_945039 [Marasmius fiardii PR-910]|nr:hypothetical protein L218DRAFT_945039 [Marasmius fiardii PR-910]